MNKISVRRGMIPIYFIVLAAISYIFKTYYESMLYLSVAFILLAVVSYWRSCRCPICNGWLNIWQVKQEKQYTCPHCQHVLEVEK